MTQQLARSRHIARGLIGVLTAVGLLAVPTQAGGSGFDQLPLVKPLRLRQDGVNR